MIYKINPYIAKSIPISGWIIVIVGFIFPIENKLLYIAWLIILFACAGLHTIQLIFSIPLGRRAGFGYPEIVFKTLLFGATWWMPMKHAVAKEAEK